MHLTNEEAIQVMSVISHCLQGQHDFKSITADANEANQALKTYLASYADCDDNVAANKIMCQLLMQFSKEQTLQALLTILSITIRMAIAIRRNPHVLDPQPATT